MLYVRLLAYAIVILGHTVALLAIFKWVASKEPVVACGRDAAHCTVVKRNVGKLAAGVVLHLYPAPAIAPRLLHQSVYLLLQVPALAVRNMFPLSGGSRGRFDKHLKRQKK